MSAACEVQPGHTYLMPVGCTTCPRWGGFRLVIAMCVESARTDQVLMVARYANLTHAAAVRARAGQRKDAQRIMGLRAKVLAWLELNPCADGAMIEVAP